MDDLRPDDNRDASRGKAAMIDTMELCRQQKLGQLKPLYPLPIEKTPSDILLEKVARNRHVESLTHWYRFERNCYVLLKPFDDSTVKIDAIWVERKYRRNGLATRFLDLLKSYCDEISGCRLVLFPVPFRFTVPIETVNLDDIQRTEFKEELHGPIRPTPSPDWRELQRIYSRAGFIEQHNWPFPMSEYGKKLGRLPLIYESKKR